MAAPFSSIEFPHPRRGKKELLASVLHPGTASRVLRSDPAAQDSFQQRSSTPAHSKNPPLTN
ncbi:Hypothetical protein SMAX5B_016795 [Scophthalmus maximus]|uniref:Uncharacterized protein n=1 Tax=Scophthalmus maximus TaxID=52904 RepID=A0A2U9CDN2_SCOMX|nr:Hypothetical protein SMAX5B_016795 [Scophthalmus maximus]